MEFIRSDAIDRIHQQINHPVIDGDGHLIEFAPLVRDLVREEAGESVAARYEAMMGSGARFRDLPHDQKPRSVTPGGACRRGTPWTGPPPLPRT